ncbi:MAG: SagB/ThcOx family dehydrogenase [Tannerella sp.]|jgi:SagB-type dehydrogenase family enzyme|nr:SagB/ThcOx family dehydrogenase [Tannerella sp.]
MKTKRFFLTGLACLMIFGVYAQDLQTIKLNAPNKQRGTAVMQALSDRHSERAFDARALNLQDISDLLWAANGVNRPDGKRTAPSAMNRQEVDVYAILPEGAYLYDAQNHSLNPIAKGDYRPAIAGQQDFAKTAPLCLLLVVNLEKLGDPTVENIRLMGAVDAGIVSQNINIFCSAAGLSTVPRASMEHETLRKVLNLKESQLPIMNNPVGYPKK